MKIVVDAAVDMVWDSPGRPMGEPPLTPFPSVMLPAEELSLYLSQRIADLGVVGGTNYLTSGSEGRARLQCVYFSPSMLSADDLSALKDDTVGQWLDGVGEGGFALDLGETRYLAYYRDGEEVRVWQEADETPVKPVCRCAIFARSGAYEELKRCIELGEEVNCSIQGYSALHLAVLRGRVREAVLLIDAGADVNAVDKDGHSPLQLCSLSNVLVGDDAAGLVRALVAKGANPRYVGGGGKTASDLALLRGKVGVASTLQKGSE